tara:strand:- start:115 stop:447 length:333 start_codon:yes stop_codon:yes gene_type:complete
MASSQYIPGNFKYGTNVNITGQFTNLTCSGAFNVPTVQNSATSAPVAASHLDLASTTVLSHTIGVLSIKNTNSCDLPTDIQVFVNGIEFVIVSDDLIFLVISETTVKKMV